MYIANSIPIGSMRILNWNLPNREHMKEIIYTLYRYSHISEQLNTHKRYFIVIILTDVTKTWMTMNHVKSNTLTSTAATHN